MGYVRSILMPGFLVAACLGFAACNRAVPSEGDGGAVGPLFVQVVADSEAQRVDVLVGGQPFTSYVYTDTLPVLKKPVLYPILTANGKPITRGFPLQPRPGERVDHPHQVGLWFTYGNVNGLDFWNNSDAIPPERAGEMGTIRNRAVKSIQSGEGEGVLETSSDWLRPDGRPLLREDTRYVFHAYPDGKRTIDRITTLTALGEPVSFADNKEGVIGMRVNRALEHPSTEPLVFTDASGKASDVPVLNNEGVTGHYGSSEGVEGEEVWGTRARWMELSGIIEGDTVTVAVLDHPDNPGFPTYWHARGYGLFAANPLGQKELSGGKEELNFSLPAGKSTTFRHRIILYAGQASPAKVDADYREFTAPAQ